jgi:hypothetical protein
MMMPNSTSILRCQLQLRSALDGQLDPVRCIAQCTAAVAAVAAAVDDVAEHCLPQHPLEQAHALPSACHLLALLLLLPLLLPLLLLQ